MPVYFNPNEDVPMDDSVPDTSLNTIIFDDMDENNIQPPLLETGFQSGSIAYDPFFTSERSADVNSFVDLAGDEPMYNSPDGVSAQTPVYPNHNYAVQTPDPGTHFSHLHHPAQIPTSYPLGSPVPYLQQTPLNYPTPASIPPAATPEIQSPKTPTKSRKRARKNKRGKQNKQKEEFICHICGRVSTCAANLKEHILTHTGVKDYFCTYANDKGETCHKRFARPWGLKRHCNEVHKLEVKVTKGGVMVILGPYVAEGSLNSPNGGRPEHAQQPSPNSPLESTGLTDDASSSLGNPYTPSTTIDMRITASGPEGPCLCATCDWPFADSIELMDHNHLIHGFALSSYCACDLCHEWFTRETSIDDGSAFSNFYGSNDDNMEVEAPENDFKLDPRLRAPGDNNTGSDIGMMDACMFAISETSTTLINADIDTYSPSPSPSSSIDEESPMFAPAPANPYADERSAAWARIAENDIVTYDPDGFAFHSCPPVSPTTFYALMGLDYTNMTDEQRRAYFGGA